MGAADLLVTLVGLCVPVAVAVASRWARSRWPVVRPEGEGAHVPSPIANPDWRAANSGLHRARVGVRVVHYATALDLYREVWELGPAPRGWHLVRSVKVALAYGRVPSSLLVSGDLVSNVQRFDADGWPFLTDSRPPETLL